MSSPLRGILRRSTPQRETEEEAQAIRPSLQEELREAALREEDGRDEGHQVQAFPGSPSGRQPLPQQRAEGTALRPRANVDSGSDAENTAEAASLWDEIVANR